MMGNIESAADDHLAELKKDSSNDYVRRDAGDLLVCRERLAKRKATHQEAQAALTAATVEANARKGRYAALEAESTSLAAKRSAVEETRGDALEAGDAKAAEAAQGQLDAVDRELGELRLRMAAAGRAAEKATAALAPLKSALKTAEGGVEYWQRVSQRRDELEFVDRIVAVALEADASYRLQVFDRARDRVWRSTVR